MTNPWNGKVVLEVFWWNPYNTNYSNWYTYLAKLAPTLAALGFDGIWTPPPCKDAASYQPMGYTPYDYYDIGQKNQKGQVATGFGPQDDFLRMIAVAHANGLEVYPDLVLDHCAGGDEGKNYQFSGFASAGRWPHSWLDFHANPVHSNMSGNWCPTADNSFGNDICYQGRCSDSGNADSNSYMRAQARAWLTWFVRQTGVDGFRFDDVIGFPPEVIEDMLYSAMGDRRDYFCVGEYLIEGQTNELDNWADDTNNRSGTFDYPFRYALRDLVTTDGYYNVGNLPSLQQQNRFKTVPFINNHDNYDNQVGPYLNPDDPRTRLAYAIAMTVDGSPQLFLPDLFWNFSNLRVEDMATRPWLQNLVWCHQKLAFKSGDYFVRYQDSQQLLILERGARAVVAINNDGDSWHRAWISTAFFPNTELHDYSGSRSDNIWTNSFGWVEIAVPPLSYSVWGPTGIDGGFSPTPRRTLQQFELADDLGDGNPDTPCYGGNAIPAIYRTAGAIWPASGSEVNVFVYADNQQQIDLQVLSPAGHAVLQQSGQSAWDSPLQANFAIGQEGRHVLQAKLTNAEPSSARLYIKVDYLGPASSTVF